MKDSGQTNSIQKPQGGQRDNNFNLIRLIATVFVFAGHMGMLINGIPPLLGGFRLHELGVGILFLMSGYLITKSWMSDPNPLRYGIRRFFRLWPPFAVLILLMVFVTGPLLSDLGVQGYYQSWYKAYLQNLRFFIVYAQPGVFTDLPLPNTTNGSLWTMPVEAALYVITPLLLTILRVRRNTEKSFYPMAVLVGVACGFDLYLRISCTNASVVFYGTNLLSAYHLIVFYIIGILFTYEKVRRHLNIQIGSAALFLLFIFQFSAEPLQYLLLYMILPYFIFSLAFASEPVFCKLGKKVEPSYGIYLYGFFFQQLVIYLLIKQGGTISYMKCFILSAIPTLVAAFLSYFLVEKPAMRFSRFLIRKLKNENNKV